MVFNAATEEILFIEVLLFLSKIHLQKSLLLFYPFAACIIAIWLLKFSCFSALSKSSNF